MATKRGLHRYKKSLDADILQFFEAAYPARDKKLLEPRWRWMFLDSAARCGVEPYVWLHHDGSRVTAHQGAIAVRFWDGERETTTGWFVETMALPDVRGTAIGPSVVMKAKQDLPFNLSLGQTADMRELQYRLGWQNVGPLSIALKPINWNAFLKAKLPSFLATITAPLLSVGERLRSRNEPPRLVATHEVEVFGDHHDRLWEEVRLRLNACVVRDASYLNWKYITQPGQDFIRLEFRISDDLAGLAVLRLLPANKTYRYTRMQVIEFLADPSKGELITDMLRAIIQESVVRSADAIVFMHLAEWLVVPLQETGFISRPPTRYLLVSNGAGSGRAKANAIDARNWFLTQGDSDIDRPW